MAASHSLQQLLQQLHPTTAQVKELSCKIDALYGGVFVGVQLPPPAEGDGAATEALASELAAALPDPATLTEAGFGELGRASPRVRWR